MFLQRKGIAHTECLGPVPAGFGINEKLKLVVFRLRVACMTSTENRFWTLTNKWQIAGAMLGSPLPD